MAQRAAGSAGRGETWVVVPLRGLEAAKSRLGGQLDAEERLDLVTGLLERTLAAAAAAPGVDHVLVVSPDPAALELADELGARTLSDPGDGLNAALAAARDHAMDQGAGTLLVLPADLARISPAAIEAVIAAANAAHLPDQGVVALVPDRHGQGTNALLLSPPDVIGFAFGRGSRERHLGAATAAGAASVEVEGELTLDVDTPDDLLLAEMSDSPAEAAGSPAQADGSPVEVAGAAAEPGGSRVGYG
jgi:2-phospho-L-lactate guanylyltransferase